MSLETKFENFRVEDGESIEDMYVRLMHIQSEYIELGESLSNNKVVRKLLRVVLRRPRWEASVSVLKAMQGINDTFLHTG